MANRAGLSGTIDSHPLFTVAALKKLNHDNLISIYLNGNNLSGRIPDSLAELTKLRTNLWLQNNQLSGPIPPEAGNAMLYRLWLHNNNLSGAIPPEIKNTINLYMQPSLSAYDPDGNGRNDLLLGGNALYGPVTVSITPSVVDEEDLANTTFTATITLDEGTAYAGAFHITDGQGNTLPAANGKLTATDVDDVAFSVAKCDSSSSPWTCTPNTTAMATFSLAHLDDDAWSGQRTIAFSAAGTGAAGIADTGLSGSASVTINEDDPLTKSGVTITPSWGQQSLQLPAGQQSTYTVSLASQPASSVIVSVDVRDTDANFTVSPSSHEFTRWNWNNPQTFTITAHQDNNLVAGSANINLTAYIYKDDGSIETVRFTLAVGEEEVSACPTTVIDTDADTYRVTGQSWKWHTDAANWVDRPDCQSQAQMRTPATGNRVSWAPARYYQFAIPENGAARDGTITMETDNLDPALFLRNGTKTGAALAQDAYLSVTNGKRIARVRQSLAPGTYVIEATTPGWNQDWTGAEPRVGKFKVTVTGLNDDIDTSPECDVNTLNDDNTASATWDGSCDSYWTDPNYPLAKPARADHNARWYKFQVTERALYTVTLKSSEANAWLFLRSGNNAKQGGYLAYDNNDDGRWAAYNFNFPYDARIQRWLDPGWYTVEATNHRSGGTGMAPHETGPFTLKVKETRLALTNPDETLSATGATLTLSGWNLATLPINDVNQDVPWHYRADVRPHNTCSAAQDGTTVNLTGLSPDTEYTYTAYEDAGCTRAIASASFKTLAMLVFNDGVSSVTVPEGSTATYTVRLRDKPSANVTVTISASNSAPNNDADITVTSPSNKRLTFTPDNWSTTQTVTLSAADDNDQLSGRRDIVHTTSSSDSRYNYKTATLLAVEVESSPGIVITDKPVGGQVITGVSVHENGTSNYYVALTVAPATGESTTVTIAEGAGDTDITVTIPSNKTLIFTSHNWQTRQLVTLSAAADDGDQVHGTRAINHTANGGGYSNVTATLTAAEVDDDVNSGQQQGPPAGVSSVTAAHNGDNVTASWPASDGATKYHVTYSTDGGSSWHAPVDDHTNITATSVTISNADSDKTYVVGVRAGNDGGWSGWVNSAPASDTSQGSPPGSVSSVTATHNGSTVTSSWDAPSGATKYHVTYSDDGGSSWHAPVDNHTNVTATSVTISNADSTKTYIVGVRAGNDAGWSGWVNSAPAKHNEGASTQ